MNSFNSIASCNNNIYPKVWATMNNVALMPILTTNGTYNMYTFTSNGKMIFNNIITDISVIIVGGGGGGGGLVNGTGNQFWPNGNGGGGGGGVGYGTISINNSNLLNITVGAKGLGTPAKAANNNELAVGNMGGHTYIIGKNIYEIAYGGGAGQNELYYGQGIKFSGYVNAGDISCGNGGGGSSFAVATGPGGTGNGGLGILNYSKFNGGTATGIAGGGGGGGANQIGSSTSNANGANGGDGIFISVDNSTYGRFGSGGGGGINTKNTNTTGSGGLAGSLTGGGLGGGVTGNPRNGTNGIGSSGGLNTGSGGGGASGNGNNNSATTITYVGGDGGSGVCYIFVPVTAMTPNF